MNAAFANAGARILADIGEDVIVQHGTDPALTVRALVEDGVARIGQYGNVIGRQTKLTFLRSDFIPQRGDTVTLNGIDRKIEAIDTDDGFIVEAVLHG